MSETRLTALMEQRAQARRKAAMAAAAGVFMAMILAVFIAYGTAAATLRRHVLDRPAVARRFQRTFAGLFASRCWG